MKWALLALSLGAMACGGEEGEEELCLPVVARCWCEELTPNEPDPMRCYRREPGCVWTEPEPEPGTYADGPCGAGGWCDCWLECVDGRCLDLRSFE